MREHLRTLLSEGRKDAFEQEASQWFDATRAASAGKALLAVVEICQVAAMQKCWDIVADWAQRGLALKAQDTTALVQVQLALSAAEMYRGNEKRAERALAAFDKLARKTPNLDRYRAVAEYNRALLMRFRDDAERETIHFQNAAAGFATVGDKYHELQCHLAAAWASLLRNDSAAALPEMLAAEELEVHGDNGLRNDAQANWALYYHLNGEFDRAEQICRRLLGQEQVEPRNAGDAYWILGCVARAKGNLDLARTYGDKAYDLAIRDYWPPQVERIEALRRVAIAN